MGRTRVAWLRDYSGEGRAGFSSGFPSTTARASLSAVPPGPPFALGSHPGSHPPGHHGTDPAALRAAMDTAAHDALASATALMTPVMLAAHIAAIGSALLVIAALAGALAWVSARSMPPISTAHLVAVVAVVPVPRGADAPLKRYLVSRGGTRAPPAAA